MTALLTGNVSQPSTAAFCERFASFLSSRNCLAFFGLGFVGSRPTPKITQQQ